MRKHLVPLRDVEHATAVCHRTGPDCRRPDRQPALQVVGSGQELSVIQSLGGDDHVVADRSVGAIAGPLVEKRIAKLGHQIGSQIAGHKALEKTVALIVILGPWGFGILDLDKVDPFR